MRVDDDVGRGDQIAQHGRGVRLRAIEGDRSFVREHIHRRDAAVVFVARMKFANTEPVRRLEDRDRRTEVGHQPRAPRGRDRVGQVEHPQVAED